MSQPDYENDLVFPPKEKMKKCNEKYPKECHCAFRCLSNEFCDAAEIRIKDLKAELQQLKDENKQMFDLLEMVARGITLYCDTEDVIRITSAIKRFCISKHESEER